MRLSPGRRRCPTDGCGLAPPAGRRSGDL
jgi:hypothetical protein